MVCAMLCNRYGHRFSVSCLYIATAVVHQSTVVEHTRYLVQIDAQHMIFSRSVQSAALKGRVLSGG